MPPRTRRGAPRGGAAASRAPKQKDAPASEDTSNTSNPSNPLAQTPTVISSSENTPAPSLPPATSTPSAPASTSIPARSFVFKPKVVRRTDDERKALAEQEEKKFNDRAAEEARLKRAASRGRGRGRGGRGRGRGDFGGRRDGLNRRTVEADGPFSQLPGASGSGPNGSGFGGGGGRGRPGFAANGGGFSAGGSGGIGRGRGGGSTFSAVAADHEYDPRLNTETFMGRAQGDYSEVKDEGDAPSSGTSSLSNSMTISSRSGKSSANLLPMGIRREEHREPEVIVATTAELEAADAAAAAAAALAQDDDLEDEDDDELFYNTAGSNAAEAMDVDSGDSAGDNDNDDNEVWSRAIKTNGSVTIVDASGNEIVVTDIDTLAEKQAEIAAARAAVKEEADDLSVSLDSLPPKKAKKAKKARAKKAAELLPKDAEDLSIEEGLQAMLHDLAMDHPPQEKERLAAETVLVEGEGETPAVEEAKEQPRREGRLFLFQFPPVLPSLKPIGDGFDDDADFAYARTPGLVKSEPGDDVVMDGVAPIDLTEADSTTSKTSTKERVDLADIGQGGFLGTLSIRQSGRAELSWGGMTYEMMPGTDVNFLTTAVLLEESDEKRKGESAAAAAAAMVGNAFGMGSVGGKYNLVPVFSDETDWVVDPSELVVDEED